jgi:hypothetical protein
MGCRMLEKEATASIKCMFIWCGVQSIGMKYYEGIFNLGVGI